MTPSSSESPKNRANETSLDDSTRSSYVIIFCLFLIGSYFVSRVFSNMPNFSEQDLQRLRTHGWSGFFPGPRSIADVKELKEVILNYRDGYYELVIVGFSTLYIFMQIFAIPGTIFLSVLAGPLFGIFYGLIVVSICATSGSSISFLLSRHVGKPLVLKYFSERLKLFQEKVQLEAENNNLFWYVLFLRITPILPNVFINLASPIVNVPLRYFFFGTLCGLMPANYLHVNTGLALAEITDDGLGPKLFQTALKLGCLGFLALLPSLFKGYLAKRAGYDKQTNEATKSS